MKPQQFNTFITIFNITEAVRVPISMYEESRRTLSWKSTGIIRFSMDCAIVLFAETHFARTGHRKNVTKHVFFVFSVCKVPNCYRVFKLCRKHVGIVELLKEISKIDDSDWTIREKTRKRFRTRKFDTIIFWFWTKIVSMNQIFIRWNVYRLYFQWKIWVNID